MNKLSNEHSAYLRSAAHQPIHWYPWCSEAFERAQRENKPILLDIGAVWCHWCHVMDGESYENEAIASIINEHFVAIKVDRDERPDIDARYQAAVSAISGQGGWPLTAFLTPDGRVFYGGTYFPSEDRYGRPGFQKVLQIIAETYRNEPEKARQNAEEIQRLVSEYLAKQSAQTALTEYLLDAALNSIGRAYDARYGGFGSAPKFPHPSAIEFLLTRYLLTGEQWMIDTVTNTLRAMAKGGIYDQLGGGFHRYSTDERWIVPHFEKMLYDNAPLLKNYVHAYQVTGDTFFREIALDIIRFVREVLSDHTNGGFFASQDADVHWGDDGSYFTWSLADAQTVLTADELSVIRLHYNLHEQGEMHHDPTQNVLFIEYEPEQIATILRKPLDEVRSLLTSGKEKLRQARSKRKAPFVDTTIYASWNGMMISALLHAYRVFDIEDLRELALKSLERILAEHTSSSGLITHRQSSVAQETFLDDQVETIQALLDAFEISGSISHLTEAQQLMDRTIEQFWDRESAGFTDIPASHAQIAALTVKNKPIQDSPTPAGNSVAVLALLRLYTITEQTRYREYAEKTLQYFSGSARQFGLFASTYFLALESFLTPPPHVVIVSTSNNEQGAELHSAALKFCTPRGVVTLVDPTHTEHLAPTIQAMVKASTIPSAFVCYGFACSSPIHTAAALESTLQTTRHPQEISS